MDISVYFLLTFLQYINVGGIHSILNLIVFRLKGCPFSVQRLTRQAVHEASSYLLLFQ